MRKLIINTIAVYACRYWIISLSRLIKSIAIFHIPKKRLAAQTTTITTMLKAPTCEFPSKYRNSKLYLLPNKITQFLQPYNTLNWHFRLEEHTVMLPCTLKMGIGVLGVCLARLEQWRLTRQSLCGFLQKARYLAMPSCVLVLI